MKKKSSENRRDSITSPGVSGSITEKYKIENNIQVHRTYIRLRYTQ